MNSCYYILLRFIVVWVFSLIWHSFLLAFVYQKKKIFNYSFVFDLKILRQFQLKPYATQYFYQLNAPTILPQFIAVPKKRFTHVNIIATTPPHHHAIVIITHHALCCFAATARYKPHHSTAQQTIKRSWLQVGRSSSSSAVDFVLIMRRAHHFGRTVDLCCCLTVTMHRCYCAVMLRLLLALAVTVIVVGPSKTANGWIFVCNFGNNYFIIAIIHKESWKIRQLSKVGWISYVIVTWSTRYLNRNRSAWWKIVGRPTLSNRKCNTFSKKIYQPFNGSLKNRVLWTKGVKRLRTLQYAQ